MSLSVPSRLRRPRLLIVGCGDVGMRVLRLLGRRWRVFVLTSRPERAAEFIDIWNRYAARIEAFEAMPCGHYMQEEMPDRILEHFMRFFAS